ncbi:hypothetical protein [Pantoea vagans]|uniref:hypothetical protein n=1 Tax=Pantoea vagans TaxID=470934 RepID=UPI00301ADDF5
MKKTIPPGMPGATAVIYTTHFFFPISVISALARLATGTVGNILIYYVHEMFRYCSGVAVPRCLAANWQCGCETTCFCRSSAADVKRMSDTMSAISVSASKVNDMTSIIESIAFQTNLSA